MGKNLGTKIMVIAWKKFVKGHKCPYFLVSRKLKNV